MAADAPWTKLFHDDFLQGCRSANLKADEVGIYATVLFLIASRGAPIEFDSAWIAGFAGCSTRKATTVINKLAGMRGKLVVRNGMIGNRKMLGVIAKRDEKSDLARKAALARWHGDDAELPLDEPPAKQRADYRADKRGDNREINAPIKSKKPRKSAISGDADASPPVRARDSETQINIPSQPKESVAAGGSGEAVSRLDDADLQTLYSAVADASGHNPSSPGQIDRAMGFVERWRSDGLDFDEIIIPTIRAMVAKTSEPTRTLGRFDAAVRHEQARRKATPRSATYRPPEAPVLEPDGEDALFRPLRLDLLKLLGPVGYASYANSIRFKDDQGPGGKRIATTRDPRPVQMRLMNSEYAHAVRGLAKRHGFDDVW